MVTRGNPLLDHQLARAPAPLRAPLARYMCLGCLPKAYPVLMLMLSGQLTEAGKLYAELYPRARITLAELNHNIETVCDLATGHPVYMARWHEWGGLKGRPPQ